MGISLRNSVELTSRNELVLQYFLQKAHSLAHLFPVVQLQVSLVC